ncbi:MAG: hypothetical protein A2W22_04405 [Candidatus Levybacteria bacterium RBG_16_35_11]|nr:MAG: hypothetical protein A2W22_04405 [Candidatus Levybacteria bacterium RBG_16_35_11]
MLTNSPITATIRVTDLKKAKDFYQNNLGLKLETENPLGDLLFKAGGGLNYIFTKARLQKLSILRQDLTLMI